MLLPLVAALAACAGPPAGRAPEATPSGQTGAPTVSIGGTLRGFYGYTR